MDNYVRTIDLVAAEYENGERNPYKIAEKCFVSVKTVREYLYRLGLKIGHRHKKYNRCEKTQMIMTDLRLGVLSQNEIARKHEVTRQYVCMLNAELKREL